MTNLYEHIFEEISVPANLTEVWTPKQSETSIEIDDYKPTNPESVRAEKYAEYMSRESSGLGAPQPYGAESTDWVKTTSLPDVASAQLSGKLSNDEDLKAEQIKEIIASKHPSVQRDGYSSDVYPGPVVFPDMFFPESISSEKVDEAKALLDKLTASVEIKSPTKPVNFKFGEDAYLAEALAYITATYDGHYSAKTSKYKGHDTQATEVIFAADLGIGFCAGDIIKYAARLGKKDGYNRKDVLKIIHYATMLLHVLDNTEME